MSRWRCVGQVGAVGLFVATALASVAGAAARQLDDFAPGVRPALVDTLPDGAGAEGGVVAAIARSVVATLPDVAAPPAAAVLAPRSETAAPAAQSATDRSGSYAERRKPRSAKPISGPTTLPNTATPGAKPGWGCGDKNHEHFGPPGNPSATRPCKNPNR